jgi:hypothetical protein
MTRTSIENGVIVDGNTPNIEFIKKYVSYIFEYGDPTYSLDQIVAPVQGTKYQTHNCGTGCELMQVAVIQTNDEAADKDIDIFITLNGTEFTGHITSIPNNTIMPLCFSPPNVIMASAPSSAVMELVPPSLHELGFDATGTPIHAFTSLKVNSMTGAIKLISLAGTNQTIALPMTVRIPVAILKTGLLPP